MAEGARSSVAFVSSERGRPVRRGRASSWPRPRRQAYVDGVSAAVLTGAAVLVAAAVFVFFRAPERSRLPPGRAGGPALDRPTAERRSGRGSDPDLDLGQLVQLGLAHRAGRGEDPLLLGADPLVDQPQQRVRQGAGLPDRDLVRQRLPEPR